MRENSQQLNIQSSKIILKSFDLFGSFVDFDNTTSIRYFRTNILPPLIIPHTYSFSIPKNGKDRLFTFIFLIKVK
jgi:hypothetical protein